MELDTSHSDFVICGLLLFLVICYLFYLKKKITKHVFNMVEQMDNT